VQLLSPQLQLNKNASIICFYYYNVAQLNQAASRNQGARFLYLSLPPYKPTTKERAIRKPAFVQ